MNLSGKTPEQRAEMLTVRIYEANLLIRSLEMDGVPVDVDLVDRKIAGAHCTAIQFQAGEWAYPPREPG